MRVVSGANAYNSISSVPSAIKIKAATMAVCRCERQWDRDCVDWSLFDRCLVGLPTPGRLGIRIRLIACVHPSDNFPLRSLSFRPLGFRPENGC